ncbi:MAG: hypothetical protein FD153_1119, partial [Rhodospirillaceae bacterium]
MPLRDVHSGTVCAVNVSTVIVMFNSANIIASCLGALPDGVSVI